MCQGERFREFTVQAQGGGERAGDLGYFEGVSQATAEMVAWKVARQTREDLGLSRQTAKGARMEDAGAVAGKGRAIRMGRLWMYTGRESARAIDGDVFRQRIIQFC
jgi:hypothetical protein